MKQFTYTITNEVGLHARPAGKVVTLAGKFDSQITAMVGERSANLKSILSVMTLGAVKGAEVTVAAEGSDEAEAAAALEELFRAEL